MDGVFVLLNTHPELKSYTSGDESLLACAARKNRDFFLRRLLEWGCDPDVRDTTGSTLLMDYCSVGVKEKVVLLLKHGADPNMQNLAGETSLSFACAKNHFSCARVLYEHGADLNKDVGENGGKPLDWAIRFGSKNFVKWLRAHGAIRGIK